MVRKKAVSAIPGEIKMSNTINLRVTYDAKVMAQDVDPYFSPKQEC
jgi:hypothetical protein